jgi:hypothetical protein
MPTPKNAPYKKEQQAAKASKFNAYPIWVSCMIINKNEGTNLPVELVKVSVKGTKRTRHNQIDRPRGKANVKAAKRSTHIKRHYWQERWEAAIRREANRMKENFNEALAYLDAVSPKAAAIIRLAGGVA